MKKLLVVLAALLALLMLAGAAQADRYPTNPNRQRDLQLARKHQLLKHARGDQPWDSFTLEAVSVIGYDSPIEIAIIQSEECTGTYSFFVQVYDRNAADDEDLLYSLDGIEGFSFTIPALAMPAVYEVTLFAYNVNDGSDFRWADLDFTLEPDANHPALADKVAGIVNQCRVSGNDWQTALNLHDWLTHNACYDYSYTMYGPDGVLYKGTGVCDSYSKAYNLLLQAAGIPVCRVISPPENQGGINHAWNEVCIDDIWAHVDATWDDPGNSTAPRSGSESHHFFCLSEDFLRDSRFHGPHYGHTSPHPAPSMANSAIIRLNEEWDEVNTWVDDNGNTGEYTGLIQEQVDLGQTSFDIDVYPRVIYQGGSYDTTYVDEEYDNLGYFNPKFHLLAYVQEYRSWQDAAGNAVTVAVTFNKSDRVFHVEVSGAGPEPAPGIDVCVLPESTESLGAEAFRGTAFREFVLPDRPVTVAADCFAGLTVDAVWVTIPNAASVVDPAAFPADIQVTIIAPADLVIDSTPVADYCQAMGWGYLAE